MVSTPIVFRDTRTGEIVSSGVTLCMADGWRRIGGVGDDFKVGDADCLVQDAERRSRLERGDDPDCDDSAMLELSDPADVLVLDATKRRRAERGLSNASNDDVDCLVRDAERRAREERMV